MQITVTFRHMEPTEALRTHAEERLARVKKFLHRPGDAHVILEVEKDRHSAEITWQADHTQLVAKEVTHDLYAAIDLAVTKLEHQAQRLHARRAEHKGAGHAAPAPSPRPSGGTRSRAIVAGPRVDPTPITADAAAAQLDATGDAFVVFTHVDTKAMAVLYRRGDGSFGLITGEE